MDRKTKVSAPKSDPKVPPLWRVSPRQEKKLKTHLNHSDISADGHVEAKTVITAGKK